MLVFGTLSLLRNHIPSSYDFFLFFFLLNLEMVRFLNFSELPHYFKTGIVKIIATISCGH